MTDLPPRLPGRWGYSSRWSRVLPWICTSLLLVGICSGRMLSSQTLTNAVPYHDRVRSVAQLVPFHFNDWLGVDVPVPQGAVTLLKPNVMISRRYEDMNTGRHATLLVVQCKDARDILGHYPPVCYAGQGWVPVSATPHDWNIDGISVAATRYVFTTGGSKRANEIRVDNFMVLPNGMIVRNMDEVERAAQDSQQKYFGAAQVQVVTDPSLSEDERTEVLKEFVSTLHPLIVTIARKEGKPVQ